MRFSHDRFDNLSNFPVQRVLNRNAASIASDMLPLGDFICILLAASISALIYNYWLASPDYVAYSWDSFGRTAVITAVIAPFMLYNKYFDTITNHGRISDLIRDFVLRFTLFSAVVLALGLISEAVNHFPRGWLEIWFVSSLLLTSLLRLSVAHYVRRLQRQGVLTEVIAVVGAGPVADRLIQMLRQNRPHTVELLGVFDDKSNTARDCEIKPEGNIAQLLELAKTRKIDWILLTLPPTAEQRVLSVVQRLKSLSVPIGLCPPHIGLTSPDYEVDYVGDNVPVDLLADKPIKQWGIVVKAFEDYLLGTIITLLSLPVLAVIALIIKLDSPGPIIFKQRRHAFNNSEFYIYKFRTMRWNPKADNKELMQTTRNDDRFTRVGRFLRASSLDELPQLFNVLKGEMSLVGPRPHAVNMRTENLLCHEITKIYSHRHRVKPGITGWSQVNGSRGAVNTTEQLQRRVELDLYYIENWSLFLDIKIFILTCGVVIKRTNAY